MSRQPWCGSGFAKPVPLSKAERKRLRKLDARYKALFDKHADGDMPPEIAAKLESIEAAVAALQKEAYAERDLAVAGAFVTLAYDGSVRIERGFVRSEDEPKSKAKDKPKQSAKDAEGLAPLSEKLVAELTAYRTSALRNELARHPETALIALVHALTLATFFEGSEGSCLEIAPKSAWLSGHAPGIDDSPAERQIAERHASWGKRLPEESEALWTFIHGPQTRNGSTFWRIACRLPPMPSAHGIGLAARPRPMPYCLPARSRST